MQNIAILKGSFVFYKIQYNCIVIHMSNTPDPHNTPERSINWDREGMRVLTMNWQRFFDDPTLAARFEHAFQRIIADDALRLQWIDLYAKAQRVDTLSDDTTEWALNQHGHIFGWQRELETLLTGYIELLNGKGDNGPQATLEDFLENPSIHPMAAETIVRALRKVLHYGAMQRAVSHIYTERAYDYIEYRPVLKLWEQNGHGPIPLNDILALVPTGEDGLQNQELIQRIEAVAHDDMIELDDIGEMMSGKMDTSLTTAQVNDTIEELFTDRLGLFDYRDERNRQDVEAHVESIRAAIIRFGNAVLSTERAEIADQISTLAEQNLSLVIRALQRVDGDSEADMELLLMLFGRLRPL